MHPFRDFLYPTRVDFDWSSIWYRCVGTGVGMVCSHSLRERLGILGEDVDGELERPDPELMTNAKPRSIDQLG